MKTKLPKPLRKLMNTAKQHIDRIKEIDDQIAKLRNERNQHVEAIGEINNVLRTVTKHFVPSAKLIDASEIAPGGFVALKSDMTIGDAMEQILKVKKAATQKSIIEALTQAGIRISKNNPYIVLGNAIKRDGKKRFRVENGKVLLNEK
ncbi:MAG: hypothetical protein WBW16_05345 [Bacteroidota bacterium]